MSTPDTATTAASEALARMRQGSPAPEPVSAIEQRTVLPDSSSEKAELGENHSHVPPKPFTAPKVPTHFDNAAPSPVHEVASETPVSERIAHPVPRKLPNLPTKLDEILVHSPKDPETGPSFRHMGQETKPSKIPAKNSLALENLADGSVREEAATSGGFAVVNDWLDSFKEPDWQEISDKIYTSPQRFKAWINKVRFERANAVELRERQRLLEEAHGEALAENAKRLAAQAALAQRLEDESLETERIAEQKFQQELLEKQRLEEKRQGILRGQDASEQPTDHLGDPVALLHSFAPSPQPSTPRVPLAPEALAALVSSAKDSIAKHQALVDPIYVPPYAVPDTSESQTPTAQDLLRRVLFTLAAICSSIVAFWVAGDLTSASLVGQLPGSSLLSLAPTAYLLLPVIFTWAVLSAAYSWIPSQRSANRQRAVGLPFSAALVAAGIWLLLVKSESLVLACVSMLLCVVLLLRCVTELNQNTARTTVERVFTDAPISLMTGFFLVLALASTNEMLASWKLIEIPEIIAAVFVVGLGYLTTTLAMTERGRIILATGFGWGMFWLLVPRLLGPNPSLWVAIVAGMAGFVVILATENRRYQIHHAEHRAARGKRTVF